MYILYMKSIGSLVNALKCLHTHNTHMRADTHMNAYTHMHTHTHTHVYICMHAHTDIACTHARTHTHTHTHTRATQRNTTQHNTTHNTSTHTTHKHTHARMHTHTQHTRTHTHHTHAHNTHIHTLSSCTPSPPSHHPNPSCSVCKITCPVCLGTGIIPCVQGHSSLIDHAVSPDYLHICPPSSPPVYTTVTCFILQCTPRMLHLALHLPLIGWLNIETGWDWATLLLRMYLTRWSTWIWKTQTWQFLSPNLTLKVCNWCGVYVYCLQRRRRKETKELIICWCISHVF